MVPGSNMDHEHQYGRTNHRHLGDLWWYHRPQILILPLTAVGPWIQTWLLVSAWPMDIKHVHRRWYQLKTPQDLFVPEGLRARIRGKDRIQMKRENGKGTRERENRKTARELGGQFFLGNIVFPVNREKIDMAHMKILV